MNETAVISKAREAVAALNQFQPENKGTGNTHFLLEARFHNLDLNAHSYPRCTFKLANPVYDPEIRACAVVPKNTPRLFDMQLEADELQRMNNAYDQRAKIAKMYDVFIIDASEQESTLRAGGNKFLTKANVVFVQDLLKMSWAEAVKHTSLPRITGQQVSVVVGCQALSEEQLVENIVGAIHQLAQVCPFGIKNIQQLAITSQRTGVQLPIYISIKKAGQTLVTENKEALDSVFDEVLQMALDEGLLDEGEATREREQYQKKQRVF